MNALSFNQVSLNPVAQPDDQIWITSAELAKALGYARADAVNKIFERNSDEFTGRMSLNVKMTLNGINNSLRQKSVRIFSLRGCYAIAFFAKTEVAKQFRRWVLDLIENEANKLTGRTTTADDRTGLRHAVDAMVTKKGLLYPDVYRLVHQRFNVEHIDELTLEQVGEATEYLHRLMLDIEKPVEAGLVVTDYEVYEIAVAAGNIQRMALMFEHLEPALRVMDSRLYGKVRIYATEYYSRTAHLTKIVNRLHPLVSAGRQKQVSTAIARIM